ncbi:putative transcription factor sol4 [Cladobotryum mycophilum]|uniref:Transcription factor sol4 n=1 Tax=Cladobotryum mycophilum TaxID=491253 RepID=A0ABR0SPJ2_9HYPO
MLSSLDVQCNRESPCNHCSRRLCFDECVYIGSSGSEPTGRRTDTSSEKARSTVSNQSSLNLRNEANTPTYPTPTSLTGAPWSGRSLAESFGYCENSNSNTLALIKKLGLPCHGDSYSHGASPALTPDAADDVHRHLEHKPDRQILDFLVQYFVTEVHWLDQLVHIPWLLERYHEWWTLERLTLVADLEFVILILRICSYALQFLPSPGYTLDKIRGVSLAEIRSTCDELANNLEAISTAVDGRGSLIRVQHLAFFGLHCQMEGKIVEFCEVLGRAVRLAQIMGMHHDTTVSRQGMRRSDQEMERRTFCNLILQARLADFWRRAAPTPGTDYDIIAAEEGYDRFCREYLSQLPATFALVDPDQRWDKQFPKLPMQRKLLHIAIYDSLCWNFRPLLSRQASSLPAYKSALLGSQTRALAVAALNTMDSVAQLHTLLGDCHTRLPVIGFSTFEAAVLLVYLCTNPLFPGQGPRDDVPICNAGAPGIDPLQAGMRNVTRAGCLNAVHTALRRLQKLAEVSGMADIGANTLSQLLAKASEADSGVGPDAGTLMQNQQHIRDAGRGMTPLSTHLETANTMDDISDWLASEPADLPSLSDLMSMSETLTAGDESNWSAFDASNEY